LQEEFEEFEEFKEFKEFGEFLDSRSPLSRGQVYPCESRGGNDNCNLAGRPEGDQPDESGFPLEFTPAKAGAGMTIATGNDNCTGLGKDTENGDKVSEYFFREIE